MTHGRAVSAGLLAIGLGLVAGPNNAEASTIRPSSVTTGTPLVQKADYWRRFYRQHGYPPPVAVPAPVPDADALPAVNPPVVMEVPLRPASCGEYRYWDGAACVDARFNKPYLGPIQSR